MIRRPGCGLRRAAWPPRDLAYRDAPAHRPGARRWGIYFSERGTLRSGDRALERNRQHDYRTIWPYRDAPPQWPGARRRGRYRPPTSREGGNLLSLTLRWIWTKAGKHHCNAIRHCLHLLRARAAYSELYRSLGPHNRVWRPSEGTHRLPSLTVDAAVTDQMSKGAGVGHRGTRRHRLAAAS